MPLAYISSDRRRKVAPLDQYIQRFQGMFSDFGKKIEKNKNIFKKEERKVYFLIGINECTSSVGLSQSLDRKFFPLVSDKKWYLQALTSCCPSRFGRLSFLPMLYSAPILWHHTDAIVKQEPGQTTMRIFFMMLLLLNFGCGCSPKVGGQDINTVTQNGLPRSEAWEQRFVDNAGVRIEYRVREASGSGAHLAPVVFIPGMTGNAALWEKNTALVHALDAAVPRKLVAISLRGRGASDCPETGWTPQDHHSDIAAVIHAEKLGNYHLIAHSMGVAYGLGFALSRPPNEIRSFIAADYFPAVMPVTEEWARMVESAQPPLTYDPRMARHVLREQGSHDYADRLNELVMPMLVILGRKSLEPSVEQRYNKAPHHRVLWIEHGHTTFTHAMAIAAAVAHLHTSD